jgi:glycosyltransferase involved in cell wall biosynthesis
VLTDLLARGAFDVAVAHSPWAMAVCAPPIRAARLPLVFWIHNPMRRQCVDRWAGRTVPDLVIANSRYTADAMAGRYHAVRVETVYNPVPPPIDVIETAPPHRVRASLDTPEAAVVVLQASRLEPWKGQTVLLDALGRLEEVPGWVAWVAGGPQRAAERRYLEALKRTAADRGMSHRIRFLGDRSDVAALMRAADVYAQPNVEPEPFGVVFLEALWAGLPVVASASGGTREIIDERCGVLTPPGDVVAVAAALERLVTDADARRQLGEAGPPRARALCDPQTQLTRLHDVLQRVVPSRHAA